MAGGELETERLRPVRHARQRLRMVLRCFQALSCCFQRSCRGCAENRCGFDIFEPFVAWRDVLQSCIDRPFRRPFLRPKYEPELPCRFSSGQNLPLISLTTLPLTRRRQSKFENRRLSFWQSPSSACRWWHNGGHDEATGRTGHHHQDLRLDPMQFTRRLCMAPMSIPSWPAIVSKSRDA